MHDTNFAYRQDFFAGLPVLREIFIKESQRRTFGKKSMIFREGSPGDSCCYIFSGAVRTYHISENGKESVMSMHYSGALFGLADLLDGCRRQSFAEALTRTTLYTLKREKFFRLLLHEREFAMKVFHLRSRHIRLLEERLASMMLYNVMERLIHFLIFHHESIAEFPLFSSEASTPICLSQNHIAGMIGSTQSTVSQLLQQLRQEGLLEVGTKHIAIRDLPRLWDKVFRRPLGDICS